MKRVLFTLVLLGCSSGLFALEVERSTARADIYCSVSATVGVDLDTGDSGIESEAALNIRFPLLDVKTSTTTDEGDFYGWIELRNLSFRLRQDDLANNTLPGNTPPSIDTLSGQFGGSVADWLGNKPFVLAGSLLYNPYPYTGKLALVLFSQVAQTGEAETGNGLSFNKAEAVTTPLFKTYTGIKDLGDVMYEGMDTGGLVLSYEGKALRAAVKAFSHNETPTIARIPAWKDPTDTTWALGADFRYDFVKNFTFVDASAVYDFREPGIVNAGLATALTIPLNWGSFIGFQLKPAADVRFDAVAADLRFDARFDVTALLSDADKNDQAAILVGSLFLGDDRDLEYAVIFSEPLAGGWVDDVEFGFMLSAMDILGNNPNPLPAIVTGPSAQHLASFGFQLGAKNVLKSEVAYQTGLAAYFASANEDGLLAADATDRLVVKLSWQNTMIPNTKILAVWTSGNLLTMNEPFGVVTVQTKVEF